MQLQGMGRRACKRVEKIFFLKIKKISAVITARGAAEEVLRRGSKIDTALILR